MSKIFLSSFTKEADDKYRVNSIHYMPFDPQFGLGKTEEELSQEGVLVDSIPEKPPVSKGLDYHLYYNPTNGDLFWEQYTYEPKMSPEEEVSELKKRIEAMQMVLNELILGDGT